MVDYLLTQLIEKLLGRIKMFRYDLFRMAAIVMVAFVYVGQIAADEGQPLAIRVWPEQVVSIETQWGLRLAIRLNGDSPNEIGFEVDQIVTLSDQVGHVLFREPNIEHVSWLPTAETKTMDPNRMLVESIDRTALRILVDGVHIVISNSEAKIAFKKKPDAIDVLVVGRAGDARVFDPAMISFVDAYQPRIVVPVGFAETKSVGTLNVEHNTLAVAATPTAVDSEKAARRIVILSNKPWQMPEDFESLFKAMETACADSQKIFTELSVMQMNFKPSNGTHTPRWNAEHMMGRQLLFFSQVYHAVDPTIEIMDLNPKQMPADYVFAHEDWTGAEEARQLKRVSDFCRRFAFLLDGMKVTEKAKGTMWPSMKALLVQMDRHYNEHTANTIKKFELPDWPKNDKNGK